MGHMVCAATTPDLPQEHESSLRSYVKERAWLSSSETVFPKPGSRPDVARGPPFVDVTACSRISRSKEGKRQRREKGREGKGAASV